MGMYSASELRSKISTGKREMREFEPKAGKLYHLWIPKDSFFYIKKHFNIRQVPFAKHCKLKAVSCINTDPEAKKRRCPICEHIETLWEMYRKEKNSAEKKKIIASINHIQTEYIYVNAIDINDVDLPFIALRLTKSLMETLSIAINDTPIENIIWQYKKTDKNKKIEYMLLESPNDPKAIELCAEYDTLTSRDFAHGGLVDLVQALTYPTTEADYLKLLSGEEGGDDDGDENTDLNDDEETETAVKKEAPKKTALGKKKEPEVIVDDDSISLDDVDMDEKPAAKKAPATVNKKAAPVVEDDDLELDDDLGLEDEPKKPASKPAATATKKPDPVKKEATLDDDDLNLDDLEIEDIDELDVESPTKIDVTAASLNENKQDRAYVSLVIAVLVNDKKMKKTGDYATDLKAAYSVLKKNNLTVQIDEIPA